MKKSLIIMDKIGSMPYPTGSTESMISIIAKRARGGKLAMIERGSKNAMIVQMHPDVSGVATCEILDTAEQEE